MVRGIIVAPSILVTALLNWCEGLAPLRIRERAMPILPGRHQRQSPRFGGDFAFVDACVGEAVGLDCKGARHPQLVGSSEPADDSLAPARGIVNGLRISLALWGVIGLLLFLMR